MYRDCIGSHLSTTFCLCDWLDLWFVMRIQHKETIKAFLSLISFWFISVSQLPWEKNRKVLSQHSSSLPFESDNSFFLEAIPNARFGSDYWILATFCSWKHKFEKREYTSIVFLSLKGFFTEVHPLAFLAQNRAGGHASTHSVLSLLWQKKFWLDTFVNMIPFCFFSCAYWKSFSCYLHLDSTQVYIEPIYTSVSKESDSLLREKIRTV